MSDMNLSFFFEIHNIYTSENGYYYIANSW